ncbi:MAG: hypothetical protein ACFFED_01935 [Candidatus Thorarchaeota archaeon]
MEIETIKKQLKGISEGLQSERESIDDAFERLVVAATNVFRLVDGQSRTLSVLQGSPKELHGFVLSLISEIKRKSLDSTGQAVVDLNNLIKSLDEQSE